MAITEDKKCVCVCSATVIVSMHSSFMLCNKKAGGGGGGERRGGEWWLCRKANVFPQPAPKPQIPTVRYSPEGAALCVCESER